MWYVRDPRTLEGEHLSSRILIDPVVCHRMDWKILNPFVCTGSLCHRLTVRLECMFHPIFRADTTPSETRQASSLSATKDHLAVHLVRFRWVYGVPLIISCASCAYLGDKSTFITSALDLTGIQLYSPGIIFDQPSRSYIDAANG